jgi:hypothetical protein
MSVSKADFAALVGRVAVLEAEHTVLKAEIAALKAGNAASVATSKKEKKEKKKRQPNAAQLMNKAWMQHCLTTYTYPSEYTEAEEKRHADTGKKDGLLANRNHVAFAKTMQTKNASDYETFSAKWKADNAPAPVAEESAAEESAADSAAESAPAGKKPGRKSKASPAASKAKAPVEEVAEEEAPVEEPKPVPAPATGRKVIKGAKKE